MTAERDEAKAREIVAITPVDNTGDYILTAGERGVLASAIAAAFAVVRRKAREASMWPRHV